MELRNSGVLAFFIPVIMDLGGDVGTQSSTIFIRGKILGHIEQDRIWRHVLKEVSIGLSMGIFFGILAGTVAYIWQGMIELSLALGIALALTMTVASFLGFVVPYVLQKIKVDLAIGTGPLITSIKDLTGLTIYFVTASLLLSHLLY